jgi:hypothetical protein
MPTECNAELFEFAAVDRRVVVAGFDGGAITSDAGGLLLGATDRAIGPALRISLSPEQHAVTDLGAKEVV